MDSVISSLIAASASLLGFWIGASPARSSEKARAKQVDKDRRSQAADAVIDELVAAVVNLRGLPSEYLEEMVTDRFLPERWYGRHYPQLLRLVGKIDDKDVRQGLLDVCTWLAYDRTHGSPDSTYLYVESQLMLALDLVQTYSRGEPITSQSESELEALRQRESDGPF